MLDKDVVRRGYDGLADVYAAKRAPGEHERRVLEGFLGSLPPSARVLDAGCGQGAPILRRLDEEATAIGLDLSRRQLQLAAQNAPGTALLQGDVTKLPLAEGVVDAVTAFHSIIHVPLDEHRAVIDEFARVLRPDGRLLISEGPGEWCGTNQDWLDTGVEMQWNIAGAEATREQLHGAGFTILDEWTVVDDLDDGEEWRFFAARLAV